MVAGVERRGPSGKRGSVGGEARSAERRPSARPSLGDIGGRSAPGSRPWLHGRQDRRAHGRRGLLGEAGCPRGRGGGRRRARRSGRRGRPIGLRGRRRARGEARHRRRGRRRDRLACRGGPGGGARCWSGARGGCCARLRCRREGRGPRRGRGHRRWRSWLQGGKRHRRGRSGAGGRAGGGAGPGLLGRAWHRGRRDGRGARRPRWRQGLRGPCASTEASSPRAGARRRRGRGPGDGTCRRAHGVDRGARRWRSWMARRPVRRGRGAAGQAAAAACA